MKLKLRNFPQILRDSFDAKNDYQPINPLFYHGSKKDRKIAREDISKIDSSKDAPSMTRDNSLKMMESKRSLATI